MPRQTDKTDPPAKDTLPRSGAEQGGVSNAENATTEAVLLTEELLTATAHLRVAFEASFDCLFVKDRHLRYVLVNPAMEQLLGRPAKRFVGKTDALLYGEVKAEETKRLEARVLRGEAIHAELDATVGDRCLTLLVRELPLRNQEGTIVGLCGVARDISHRRESPKENPECRQQLRRIYEDAPDAHFLIDTGGRFLDANTAAEQLCGCSRAELVGKDPVRLTLLQPLQARRAARLLLRSAHGQTTGPEEFTLVRKGGIEASIEIRMFPARMANRTIVLGIARDITDLRRAKEVRNRLLAVIGQVAEGIIIADQHGRIEHVNPAYTELTGFDNEDAKGRYVSFPAVEEETQAQELRQAVLQQKHWTGRLPTLRKDGTRLIQELTLSPVHNEVGAPAGFIAIRTGICDGETSVG